jgi:repeat uncharacterized protein DUF346
MKHTRQGRWGRFASLSAMAAIIGTAILFVAAAPASAFEEHSFCTGKNLSGAEGCSSGNWYIHSAYANGTSAPICLTGPEQVGSGCMHAANEGIFIGASEPYGYYGRASIVHTVNQPPTKVYGTFWTGPQAPSGGGGGGSWYGDNLGGETTSDPAIASWEYNNRLDVFAKGIDNRLWHKYWNGISWSGWEPQPESSNTVGGPDATSWGPGRIDVVARNSSKSVDHWYWTGSSWSKDNLGGTTESDPGISSWGTNRLDVFIRGTDNALWHKYWNGSGWSAWESLGGNLAGGPSAVSWGPNRIDVVGRDSTNSLVHWWWDGTSWHANQSLGAATFQDPAIASTGAGQLNVYYAGSDNNLWSRNYSESTGWGAFSQVGSLISGGPDAVSWGGGRVDVVAPNWDAQHSVSHYYYIP